MIGEAGTIGDLGRVAERGADHQAAVERSPNRPPNGGIFFEYGMGPAEVGWSRWSKTNRIVGTMLRAARSGNR